MICRAISDVILYCSFILIFKEVCLIDPCINLTQLYFINVAINNSMDAIHLMLNFVLVDNAFC